MVEISRITGEVGGVGSGALAGGLSIEKETGTAAPEGAGSFKKVLTDAIDNVNRLQQDADLSFEKLQRGEAGATEVMIAFRKAQIAFEALMQIRNKVVDAFEEIQRMRI